MTEKQLRKRQSPLRRLTSGLLIAVALIVFCSGTLVHLLAEYWWYEAIGYSEVFRTLVGWQAIVAIATFVSFALFLWGNYAVAMSVTRNKPLRFSAQADFAQSFTEYSRQLPRYLVPVAIVLVALAATAASSGSWEVLLKFWHATPFESTDPLFERDIGFYIFQLPLYEGLQSWLTGLLTAALAVAIGVYALKGTLDSRRGWRDVVDGTARVHLCLILAAIAFLQSVNFWLQRYGLLYTDGGIVSGAGYTDAHSRLLALTLLSATLLVLSVAFVASAWRQGFTLPTVCIAAFLAIYLVVGQAYPWFEQRFVVEPDELNKELPYIEYSIHATQAAYNLQDVQREPYAAEDNLDRAAIERNQATVDNLRLWDYRPLQATYQQLQGIRPYYRFNNVDIDRYVLNGKFQQVMLSARELSQSPRDAWVSQRLKYTHGYGLVMSSVNEVVGEGEPRLLVYNIPPVSNTDLDIDEPGIYYGELTGNYIFTGTRTAEFDYPQGENNQQTQYSGRGGVPIGPWWRRLIYAWDLGSYKILISPYFQAESRIHYDRDILKRVKKLAPFLRLDSDPYIAIVDGRIQWIIEGYTVSDRYPYSKPVSQIENAESILLRGQYERLLSGRFNYARNAVKAVVDAYDGTVKFYAADAEGPLLKTYRRIFPTLFADLDTAPPSLRDRFRYPLDLFEIQAQMYLEYHMDNAEVFYNREDLWQFPKEAYEDKQQLVEPYYIIMRLPDAESEEFVLVLPFTPNQKGNLIAWLAARSDGDNYGKLLLYEFPKQKLVFGPEQIEARVNQDTEISKQFSLWNQRGSRVKRGNLLVIPIEDSLLYIRPIYLSAEQSELPQLKQAIVALGGRIVMRDTLDEALAAIFGTRVTNPNTADLERERATAALPPRTRDLVRDARATYDRAQTALRTGNWTEYGRAIDELGSTLEELERATANGPAK
ncbi:hypothetical protein KR51_00022820 [Rubidibacter lacunae KORDI 51-2]|uniref:UPF0182 protein KR51_00022820 n=1 Tax=Rubidibacter lacunae KORDI 51-2 TaxID=582515 RepID=U5DKS2_9CHRO|nr:UPF0182 family protein [Rubidibacter lacunae]ERN41154.1 hypothetical protein KR51_00022820 [Rubidibacter lacunae KORDI 51-2]